MDFMFCSGDNLSIFNFGDKFGLFNKEAPFNRNTYIEAYS